MEGILLPWTIASTILLFLGVYWIYTLERRFNGLAERYQRILALADDADQATIANLLQRLDQQGERLEQAEGLLRRFQAVLPHTVQGYGLVRYRAFSDMGGDQSFSLALVDEQGNGVLISSLHGRDGTRMYAKALTQWRSSHSLSAEEQQALGQARALIDGVVPVEPTSAQNGG